MNACESESGRAVDLEIARLRAAEKKPTGRGQPPVERQWQKGQSGNPAGRPARARASGAPGDRLIGADQPTRTMILAEAYRMVTFIEDGVRHEMPLNQAVWRAMGAAALQGNRQAQYRFTRIVHEMEQQQHAAQVVLFNALERVHNRRNPDATFADDIVVDTMVGTVLVRGETE
jgi:hypothetical protein